MMAWMTDDCRDLDAYDDNGNSHGSLKITMIWYDNTTQFITFLLLKHRNLRTAKVTL